MTAKTSPAAVSAAIRRAGVATLPSGTHISTDGVRVSKFMAGAVVNISGPGRHVVRDAVVAALSAAGFEVDESGDTLFVGGKA